MEDIVQNVQRVLFGVLKLTHVFMFVDKTQLIVKAQVLVFATLDLVFLTDNVMFVLTTISLVKDIVLLVQLILYLTSKPTNVTAQLDSLQTKLVFAHESVVLMKFITLLLINVLA